MSTPAKVTSIEALEQLRIGMADVDHQLRDAHTDLDLQLRRAMEWIEEQMPAYWTSQLKKASNGLAEALNELERCQLHVGSEEPPPCTEQKNKVERARRRLRLCEHKIRVIKNWKIKMRQELIEAQGTLGKIANFLDADIPLAVVTLERMATALRQYAQMPNRIE